MKTDNKLTIFQKISVIVKREKTLIALNWLGRQNSYIPTCSSNF